MTKNITKNVINSPSIIYLLRESLLENVDIKSKPCSLISFVNPYSYMVLRNNKVASDVVDFFYSDALISCWMFSLIARKNIFRISFDFGSFGKTFLEEVSKTEHTVFFIGAKESEIAKAVQSFQKSFPKLKVAGFRHGYFKNDQEKELAALNIAQSGASFVVCGMGTPYQEVFGQELKRLPSSIKQIYTCGGFLYQSSENILYYPLWVNKFNLRWLYRICKENYVLKRVIIQYPQFLYFCMYDYYFNQKNTGAKR
jgi:exopolysaccharide biosynthesis WecB/TagA/CpsF family protein